MGCFSSKGAVKDDDQVQKVEIAGTVVRSELAVQIPTDSAKANASVEEPPSAPEVPPAAQEIDSEGAGARYPASEVRTAVQLQGQANLAAERSQTSTADEEISGEPDREAPAPESSVSSETPEASKEQPEAIDIETILQDLDEEDEDQAAEMEKFDAMLNGEDDFDLDGSSLADDIEGIVISGPSIFDPDVIEDVEEDLRREMVGNVLDPETKRGEDVLFDPDLLDSLEEELRDQNSSKGPEPEQSSGTMFDLVKVSTALEALSQEEDNSLLTTPVVASEEWRGKEKESDSGSEVQFGNTAPTPENKVLKQRSREGDGEFWDAEEHDVSPQSDRFNDAAPAEEVCLTNDRSPPGQAAEEEVLKRSTGLAVPENGHMESPSTGPRPAAHDLDALGKGPNAEACSAISPTAMSPGHSECPGTGTKGKNRVPSPQDNSSPEQKHLTMSGPSVSLAAKPAAKGLILERLQSYRTAVEATLESPREGTPVASSEVEGRKAITPGVVARVKDVWERAQSPREMDQSSGRDSSDSFVQQPASSPKASERNGTAVLPAAQTHSPGGEGMEKGAAGCVWVEGRRPLQTGDISSSLGEPQDAGQPDCLPDPQDGRPRGDILEKKVPRVKELSDAGRVLFAAYEKRCPVGGEEAVILYVTSVRAVRKTFDECAKLRRILQGLRLVFEERDVSQLNNKADLKELLQGPCTTPQLFVRGYYIGDGESVINMHEDHLLEELLEGIPQQGSADEKQCTTCLGKKLVTCKVCNGNHKLLGADGIVSCGGCNEDGLVACTSC